MSTELEQKLDALASTVASLPKYDQAESPRALDNIREDIGDLQAELKAIKSAPQPAQGGIEGEPQEARPIEITGYRSGLSICEIASLLADRIAHGSHNGAPYPPQVARESIRSSISSDLDGSFRRVTATNAVFELSRWIAKRRPNCAESILC